MPAAHPKRIRLAALEEYRRGVKCEAIAAEYGLTAGCVSDWARREGIRRRPQVSARTHRKQNDILRDYVAGVRPAELARRYGCHPRTPQRIAERLGLAVGSVLPMSVAVQLEMFA